MEFFLFQFYRMNSTPYPVSPEDYILVEIMHNNTFIKSSREYGGEKWGQGNMMKVSFTVREAGIYTISVLVQGTLITDRPFTKTFLPGNISLNHIYIYLLTLRFFFVLYCSFYYNNYYSITISSCYTMKYGYHD